MNDTELEKTYRRIGRELARRMDADEQNQVIELLAAIVPNQEGYQAELFSAFCSDSQEQRPWHVDNALWLRIAKSLIQFDCLPSYTRRCPERGASLSIWLQQQIEANNKPPDLQHSRFWLGVLELMSWKHLSKVLNELEASDEEQIWQGGLLWVLSQTSSEPSGEVTPWLEFLIRYPEKYFIYGMQDERIIQAIWPKVGFEERQKLMQQACELLMGWRDWTAKSHNPEQTRAILKQMLQEDPAALIANHRPCIVWRQDSSLPVCQLIWELRDEALSDLLLPAIAEWYEPGDYKQTITDDAPHTLVSEILAYNPERLLTVDADQAAYLVPMLPRPLLNRCLPLLGKLIVSAKSKGLRLALADRASDIDLVQIEASGWVKKPAKSLMAVVRDVLIAHPDPQAGSLLEKLLSSAKLDADSISRIETRLMELGRHAPLSPVEQQQRVEKLLGSITSIAKAVEAELTPELLSRLSIFSTMAAKGFWQLIYSAEDKVPALVTITLSCLSESQQAELRRYVLELWIERNGEPKLRWMLRLLAGSEDNLLADRLIEIIHAWHKPRTPRAVMAIVQLSAIDSFYALIRLQEIAENRRLRASLIDGARACLKEAAGRRQISVDELFDELTPDFGLSSQQGFLIGEQSYRIELQGDLTLRVINEKGKATKSVPKPRDTSLLEEWEVAKAQLKTMNSNLKTVLKRQGPRMEAALLSSKQWPASRWQRLFVQHPLLQVVGQSLIWQTDAGQSFRISEDRSLVDVNDEAVELTDDQPIRLWHPIHGKEGEREQWQEYLADYELEPMVDQLGAPDQLPTPEQMDDHQILAPQKLTVMQGPLASLLKKLGYRQGPVGDGPRVECHYINLDTAEYYIELHHYDYLPWMDLDHPVTIEGISVSPSTGGYWSQSINPAELPITLQAKLLDHLKQMEALAG
ncbi:MAG: DUF4132 domain-containing protein [Oceanobacter sp.]